MNLFRKKQTVSVATYKADPTSITPQTFEDYIKRGYAYHARQEYAPADEDFRKAISMDSSSTEAYYALGLNLKAQNRKEEATKAFQQALNFMNALEEKDTVRAHMLTRLTKGHINQLAKGDWDLRKEFWGSDK
ncbi:MAG: tetratricopeptide repeat protein [Anaerolineales bacterium]|jgi:tetratricopeptide (TPR) repeat protein|nr:tetratricopeptide repeat protein [Anaerolineales bacterium]